MAIVIVLMLCAVFMVTVISLQRSSGDYRHFAGRAQRDLQAYFIARSAIEHTKLKIKFFPSELHDAAALSLGKNPMFDFTVLTPDEYNSLSDFRQEQYSSTEPHVHLAGPFNPGPRFISDGTLLSGDERWSRLDELSSEDSDPSNFLDFEDTWFPDTGWPTDMNGDQILNSDLYLWRFRSDVTNNIQIQPSLGWSADELHPEREINIAEHLDRYPFQGMYEVLDMRVGSIVGSRRLGQEAIVVVVSGAIIDPITDELVTHTLEQTIRVIRN